jgi:pseudouridine synthase
MRRNLRSKRKTTGQMSPRTRINRFLASAELGSRRKCERLIKEGRVQVNGETVSELARLIDTDMDIVTVDGSPVRPAAKKVILVINKPAGVLSTVSDDRDRKTVTQLAREKGYRQRLFPVGRLDMDTTGFLLLTNDGDLAYRLTHPRYKIEKRYRVTVEGRIEDSSVEALRSGIDLGDFVTMPCSVNVIERSGDTSVLEVRLKEGKKRQIKRMFAAMGHRVTGLERTALGDLDFGGLEYGDIRELTESEEERLRELTGLS